MKFYSFLIFHSSNEKIAFVEIKKKFSYKLIGVHQSFRGFSCGLVTRLSKVSRFCGLICLGISYLFSKLQINRIKLKAFYCIFVWFGSAQFSVFSFIQTYGTFSCLFFCLQRVDFYSKKGKRCIQKHKFSKYSEMYLMHKSRQLYCVTTVCTSTNRT